MLLRLRHLFCGHQWKVVSAKYNPAIGQTEYAPFTWEMQATVWGFTEILQMCHCGKNKTTRLIGNHEGVATASELAELERMAK